MGNLSRRTVIRGSLGLAAAGTVARPYVANAAAKTATAWWNQGFVPEEDASFRAMVAEYEKQSGNIIDFSLIPTGPLMQKIVSSLTSGDVPDIMSHDTEDATVVPQNAWRDKLVDLSDIVDPLKPQLHPTAYLASHHYNSVTKKRGAYQAPFKTATLPFHVWNSLVEKAGLKIADAPKTWDAFWDFFKPVQEKLRGKACAASIRSACRQPPMGRPTATTFSRTSSRPMADLASSPQMAGRISTIRRSREAVIKTITYITTAFKEGYVPPGALDWGDADDNNAFHAQQIVMDLDGTISTEVAMIHDPEKYDDAVTLGLAQ